MITVLLVLRFIEAVTNNVTLIIHLDNVEGYAASFLDESFGRLTKTYDKSKILDTLVLKTESNVLADEIYNIINELQRKETNV